MIFSTLVVILMITNTVKASEKPVTRITRGPKKSNIILLGNNMKLEWMFEFQPVKDLQRIFLFRYSISSKAKDTIASKNLYDTDVMNYNPAFAKGEYQCDARLEKNGVGSASIIIKNMQFNYSGDYGLGLEPRQRDLSKTENSVSVRVVDMVAVDDKMKLRTVKSWVDHKTSLTCQVIYRGNTIPSFQWFKIKNELTEGITSSNNTSILKLDTTNITDFGEYICKAKTKIWTVTQIFSVVKLEYPAPPTGLQYTFYKERLVHTVFWKHATIQYQHEAKQYVIEIWKPDKKEWVSVHTTLILSMSFPKLKSTTKVRVCSSNEIGYNESSCSKPIVLHVPNSVRGNPGKRSKSYQTSPCVLLILITIVISSFKTLNNCCN